MKRGVIEELKFNSISINLKFYRFIDYLTQSETYYFKFIRHDSQMYKKLLINSLTIGQRHVQPNKHSRTNYNDCKLNLGYII